MFERVIVQIASSTPKSAATEKTAVISIFTSVILQYSLNDLPFKVINDADNHCEYHDHSDPAWDTPVVCAATSLLVQSS